MDSQELDAETAQLLQRYGFEDIPFESLRERLAQGQLGASQNRITGNVEPPEEGDLQALPPLGGDVRRALEKRGQEAMQRGEVAAVILAAKGSTLADFGLIALWIAGVLTVITCWGYLTRGLTQLEMKDK